MRRCGDVSELLGAPRTGTGPAARPPRDPPTGTGQAALLSADLRRLDGDTVAHLEAAGVAVVGLVDPGDERAVERLRRLGVTYVLPADADAETIAQALREAVAGAPSGAPDVADPRS